MPHMDIQLEGDGAFKDVDLSKMVHTTQAITVAYLENGTASGKGSVSFGIELPDGTFVIAETTAALFITAAKTIEAREARGF